MPKGPGRCNRNHTPKAPEHPTGLPKPATQPRAPRARPPTPSTCHTQAQMAQWKENYTISPRENDLETGEGGKGMLRTLLQTKHATPIKQRTKAHGMDTRVPDENTAGRKTAPALQQPNERQKRNKQNARKNAKCYRHTPQC